jgi:acetyltransferase-like isoleucine patch superfamily enzyme
MNDLEARVAAAGNRGLWIIDPRQTYISPDVDLHRLSAGAILHPGTRLSGPRTFIGPKAEVGAEGPAVLKNVVLGDGARIQSGFAEDAVLLSHAAAGANAHLRAGTLLEEYASTAHCVGLKQTILGPFVTTGSLVNFCDVVMTGGTSAEDHSEVGSGFIHFNFTPWGRRGDKATASLVGDVVHGLLLREPRIFLGGAGGLVGPGQIGFGSVTAAGQVIRKDVGPARLVSQAAPVFDVDFDRGRLDKVEKRSPANVRVIAELVALRAWYRQIRLARVPPKPETEHLRVIYEEGIGTLDAAIRERLKQYRSFLAERGHLIPQLVPETELPCPLDVRPTEPYIDHLSWVRQLTNADAVALVGWLESSARAVVERGALPEKS